MIEWFRSWHGAPTDNKWLVIARRAGTQPGIVSAIVWAVFDHASQAGERGSIATFDVETYAAFSGFPEDTVRSVLTAMTEKGIVNGDRTLASWDRRQPKREDGSAERAKAWRERTRTQTNAPERNRPTDKIREEEIREENNQSAPARLVLVEKLIFPSDGSIEYSRWAGIVRANAPGKDPDHVASLFRGFCRHQAIDFDRPSIEKTFTSFCKTVAKKAANA